MILNQAGDHKKSMKILTDNGLRPITYQEALSRSEELIEAFKGEWKWFYLAGSGIELDGEYTFAKNGAIVNLKGKEKPDKIVRVWPGGNPLSLGVGSGYYVAQYGWRFALDADYVPSYVAPVVVGLPSSSKASKHKHKFVCECGKVRT